MTNARMMEVISTMHVMTTGLDGSTLLGLSENFSAAARTLAHGKLNDTDDDKRIRETDASLPYLIEGECTVMIGYKNMGGLGSNSVLTLSNHPFNNNFEFHLAMGENITIARIEIFKAIVTKLAAITAEAAQYIMEHGKAGAIQKDQKVYARWIDIALALRHEYASCRASRNLGLAKENSIKTQATDLAKEAFFEFTDNDLPKTLSDEVAQKWLKPLPPIVELNGSSHHMCTMYAYSPLGILANKLQNKKPSALEMMRIYNQLPKIDGPFFKDEPSFNHSNSRSYFNSSSSILKNENKRP